MADPPTRRFDILLTADEAFPAFEQEVLEAGQEVIGGFRVFDPRTKLRWAPAGRIGETWFDLIVHTLNRGVRFTLFISDFDPVARTDHHAYTWACIRGLRAAAEASNNPHLLQARAVMHPAQVGLLPRLLFWPRSVGEIRQKLTEINAKPKSERDALKYLMPHLWPLLKRRGKAFAPRLIPPPTLFPASHHQKLAVFDNRRLYIGGLDLNERRYDTPDHSRAASETWHDAQVIVDGPAAAEAAEHLRRFQAVAAGAPPPPSRYLLRTISSRRKTSFPFISPRPVVNELAKAHRDQIAQSHTLIYLETQFFRDRTLAKQLARRAAEKRSLSLILILPAAPEDAAFYDDPGSDVAYGEYLQTKCVDIVRKAFGSRLFIGAPAQPKPATPDGRATHFGAPLVYVHAKVSIFDDRCGIVSSANLNGRSMAWDTEAGIATQTTHETSRLKSRCFDHWLGPDADPACYEDKTACDAWAALAAENAQKPPNQRRGFILPYTAGPAAELGYNLPGVPDEMV